MSFSCVCATYINAINYTNYILATKKTATWQLSKAASDISTGGAATKKSRAKTRLDETMARGLDHLIHAAGITSSMPFTSMTT